MSSLVADYSDSDGEDIDEQAGDSTNEAGADVRIKEEPLDAGVAYSASNFFQATDDDGDEDDESTQDIKPDPNALISVKPEPEERLPNPLSTGAEKLPSIIEATQSRIGTSVFVNPFEEAEQAKHHILEKHVKLTQAAPRKPAHQPICWKFKKGKCHMGKNCRFFHDLEGNQTSEERELAAPVTPQHQVQPPVYHPSAYHDARRRPMERELPDEDNYMASMQKKKRFGVADNLVPPKKAFEILHRQREKERPWTLPHN